MPAMSPLEAPKDLRILHFVTHIVDHKTKKLALSGLETPIGAKGSFPHDFFQGYILQALGNAQRRRACFRNEGGVVRGSYGAVMADPERFLGESQRIAQQLYDVMQQSPYARLIKPGDVMLALCEDANAAAGYDSRCLAILKIDLSDAVIRRIESVGGQQRVSFELSEDRVPASQENKVQKITVIGERQTTPEKFDLVILDNNIREVDVAHFFYDAFLECDLNRDPGEDTRFLLREIKSFVSSKPDVVSPVLSLTDRRAIVSRAAALLIKGAPVKLEDFAGELADTASRRKPEKETIRTALVDYLVAAGRPEERIAPAESVAVDRAAAQARSKTLIYLLDGGIKISGDAAQMERRVNLDGPDAAGEVTITIVTRGLEIL